MGADAHEFTRCRKLSRDEHAQQLEEYRPAVANIPAARRAAAVLEASAGKPVAVFRTGEDEFFALLDECPHKKGPLSEGIVSGKTVTCPLHNWVIGLDDGDGGGAGRGHAPSPLSVRLVDGDIYIHLPEVDRSSSVTRTTCPYCGVGCGVSVVDGIPRGDAAHPANFGRLCSKGAALKDTLALPDRLTMPTDAWTARRAGTKRWTTSRQNSCRIRAEHGPDAIAFYVSGQFLTEDYYVANKLMKGFIGSGQYRHQFAALHGVLGRRPCARLWRGCRAGLL